MFRNVCQYKPDAGETPKRKHTEYWTRRKFKIKNLVGYLYLLQYDARNHGPKINVSDIKPIPVAARFKQWVWAALLQELRVRIPHGGTDACLLWTLCVVRQVTCTGSITRPEFYRMLCECDRTASTMRMSWPTGGCRATGYIYTECPKRKCQYSGRT
jgi:hypothetical protein